MYGNSILDDLRYRFQNGDMVIKLIYVNVGVFIVANIIALVGFFAQSADVSNWVDLKLSLPAYLPTLLSQPWSVFTYMFMHKDIFHILFNMLWLFWFGEIFVLYLGDKKILPLYILGGLSGALLYIASFNLLPVFATRLPMSVMMGASASVLAIVFAAATINPNHEIRLLFFGDVRIKYVALIPLIIDILSIPKGNAGGYIAHIGGALCGWLFVKALRRGVDAGKPIGRFAEMVASQFKKEQPQNKLENKRVIYGGGQTSGTVSNRSYNEQERLDEILDKISRSGYDSLSKEEKDFLFKYSDK